MKSKIILVEGFECTGKGTLCDLLVDHYDGIYFHSPQGHSKVTKTVYDLIRNEDVSEESKRLLLLSSHIENIKMMNKLKEQGDVVIADRSILSFFCYEHITYEEFESLKTIVEIPKLNYDHVFVLTTDMDTVVDRLDKRGVDKLDEYFLIHKEKIHNKYEHYYDVIYPHAHKLNTTIKKPHQILKKAIQIIENSTRS